MEHFAWPIAISIIAIFALFLFKKDISALLGRTQKIGRDGIQTSLPQIQQSTERESAVEVLMKEFSSVALREEEENIRKDLEIRGLSSQQDKINLLIKHLAINQLALHFERINSVIWGSQIALLQHLNSCIDGDSSSMLRIFYDNAAKNYPDTFASYPFEQYLQFLVAFNLIIQRGERYFITALGREFLVYLTATGQTKWRHL